ncbi:coadhesin-like [Montipora capricornis]|uniref:coadhesin-like n=1 Tax=Montipora capricornis TaxID=246305 RepID=UPI0035F1F3FB
MADLKSGSSEDDVKAATKPLEEQDIKVIAIAVGKEADPLELGHTTRDKKNVIETAKDGKANEVGEKIMDKIREKSPVPEIDLAFAVSATATDADETFSRIKDTTKYIVKQYGTEQIHYALLAFGSVPSRARDFHRDAISKEDMISFLESVPRSSTAPDLGKALTESLKLFEGPGTRPGAKKVLVVIMDKRSGVSQSVIKDAANGLREERIKVIPVAVGKEADANELETATKDEKNLIEAPRDFEPDNLAETIMRKVLKVPSAPDVDVIFAVSATSSEAAETLRIMKDTLMYVINNYGVGSIRYGIITFGADPTVVQRFTAKDHSPEELKGLVQGLPESTGPPDFVEVLESAKNVFDGEGVRPTALKVVVVITDDRSAWSAEEIRSAAKPLEEKAIHVIAVGVGKSPDAAQLETMTQRKGDVLKAPKDVDPAELGERIMEKAFQPVLLPIEEVDLVFAMCSVSGLSNQSFELMKDTVKSIVDNYGTSKVHYTVVIYGTQALATAEFSDKALTKEDVKEYIDSLPKPRELLYLVIIAREAKPLQSLNRHLKPPKVYFKAVV